MNDDCIDFVESALGIKLTLWQQRIWFKLDQIIHYKAYKREKRFYESIKMCMEENQK